MQNEDSERSNWIELGVMFSNNDGGFSIVIDRAPYSGFPEGIDRLRLVAQPVKPAAD